MLTAKPRFYLSRLFVLAAMTLTSVTQAADWPRWNGPSGDGRVPDSNLLDAVPADGLEQLWEIEVGLGYAGPAIADGILVVADYALESGQVTNNAGARDKLTGQERIRAFDADTGKPLWSHEYDRPYAISYPSGPRATPTIADGRVFALGAEGDLVCLSLKSGQLQWTKNFQDEYGSETPIWGHAASPLVLGNRVICMAGRSGDLVVAYDAATGKEQWTALSSRDVGYCPPSVVEIGGKKRLLVWDPELVSCLDPENGNALWQQPLRPDYRMSVLPPIVEGEWMFVSGEGASAMYRLSSQPDAASVVWRGRPSSSMMLATSTAIFDDGHLYGADLRSGALMCVRASDGERLWQSAKPTVDSDRPRGGAHGSAFLMKHKSMYFMLSETGDLISAKLSPSGYEETGRCHVIDPDSKTMNRTVLWTYPAIANDKFYLRNNSVLRCYDLARK